MGTLAVTFHIQCCHTFPAECPKACAKRVLSPPESFHSQLFPRTPRSSARASPERMVLLTRSKRLRTEQRWSVVFLPLRQEPSTLASLCSRALPRRRRKWELTA